MKEQNGDYFRKFLGSPRTRNPFGASKSENPSSDYKKESEPLDKELVPIIRKEKEENESTAEFAKNILSDKEKRGKIKEINKEIEALLKKAKKEDKSVKWSRLDHPAASEFFVFKNNFKICNTAVNSEGFFLKTVNEEMKFPYHQKSDFLNKLRTCLR